MPDQETTFPAMTADIAKERNRLAPKAADAFKAFSQSVFSDGALSAKAKQLCRRRRARDTMSLLHSRAYECGAQAWRHRGGNHGSDLGRRRDEGRRRVCTFGFGVGCDRTRSSLRILP